jgi:hypothetical protein
MQTKPIAFQPSEIVEIISFERLNFVEGPPNTNARCKVTIVPSSSTCMLNHNIVEKLLLLHQPIGQRYVLNTRFSTDAVGFASSVRFAYLDRFVQVFYLKIIKQWE